MASDEMVESAWEIYSAYGQGGVAYCNGHAEDARARGDAGMAAYWGSLAKLVADIRDPEPNKGVERK